MRETRHVTLTVNGKVVSREIPDHLLLVDFLQETLGLSGTKVCCGLGICKVCTVAVSRSKNAPLERLQACSTKVTELQGFAITTVEGLAQGPQLSALQQAFLKHFSFQCGYSAPGFLMSATVLLDELKKKPVPPAEIDQAIMRAVGDHVCRCTGYVRYHKAIKEVILGTAGLTA
jgi:aerobic-type carbon monoxide dehydrogenase small subunit (CoxS/CutS family)